jgi:hypothetical protein
MEEGNGESEGAVLSVGDWQDKLCCGKNCPFLWSYNFISQSIGCFRGSIEFEEIS